MTQFFLNFTLAQLRKGLSWKGMLLKDMNEEHSHDSSVSSVTLSEKRPIDLEVFRRKLGELLWENEMNLQVYRIKGVINAQNSDKVGVIPSVSLLCFILPAGPLRSSCARNVRDRSLRPSLGRFRLPKGNEGYFHWPTYDARRISSARVWHRCLVRRILSHRPV